MAPAREELAPRLIGLFHSAGLLDERDWQAYARRNEKHKPILDVLTQEFSLRDLLNAEVTFKSGRSKAATTSGALLHAGLVTTTLINDYELEHVLTIHRPGFQEMLEPLRKDGILDRDEIDRAAEMVVEDGATNYERLVSDGVVTGDMINRWLSNPDSSMIQAANLYSCLNLMRESRLLNDEGFWKALELLDAGDLDAVRAYIRDEQKIASSSIAERIEKGMTISQVSLADVDIDPMLLGLLPQSMMRRLILIPFYQDEHGLGIAVADLFNAPTLAIVRWASGSWPQAHFAPTSAVIAKINAFFGSADGREPAAKSRSGDTTAASTEPGAGGQSPAVRQTRAGAVRDRELLNDRTSAVGLVSSLIESAIDLRTTDIHIEPSREGLSVRYRIDGELHRIMNIPASLAQPVVSRVKVLAEMDVTERRRPQDGHFELVVEDNNFDFRISTLPSINGEKIVIRILDEAQVMTGLNDLGMLDSQRETFTQMLSRPHGMILVTGPTGSGKTSTLYTGLQELNHENRNLVTIEDPVEYQLDGITQVQVATEIELTFAAGLRSILRQDPDVIMVGEIRDGDTAAIAVRAAMTGHLVLSTLHTNTALGAIDALRHLGIQSYMIAGSVIGIVSQRLVRRLCTACRQQVEPDEETRQRLELGKKAKLYAAKGCEECFNSGYQGRVGVFEVVSINERLRPLIAASSGFNPEVELAAREEEMMDLKNAALEHVRQGVTSLDEVRRRIAVDL